MNVAASATGPDYEESVKPPWWPDIPERKDVFVGELARVGEWIVANISTDSFWPVTAQKVRWGGIDIWIMPIMKNVHPAVAVMIPPGKSRAHCEELIMRFL